MENDKFQVKSMKSQYLIADSLGYAFFTNELHEFLFKVSRKSRICLISNFTIIQNLSNSSLSRIDSLNFGIYSSPNECMLLFQQHLAKSLKINLSNIWLIGKLIDFAEKYPQLRVHTLKFYDLDQQDSDWWFLKQGMFMKQLNVQTIHLKHCKEFEVQEYYGVKELIIEPRIKLLITANNRSTVQYIKTVTLLNIQYESDLEILKYIQPLESLRIQFKYIIDNKVLIEVLSQLAVKNVTIEMPSPVKSIISSLRQLKPKQFTLFFKKLDYDLSETKRNQLLEVTKEFYDADSVHQTVAEFSDITNPRQKMEDLRYFLSMPNQSKSIVYKEFLDNNFDFLAAEDTSTQTMSVALEQNSNSNLYYLQIVSWLSKSCSKLQTLDLQLNKNKMANSFNIMNFYFAQLQRLKLDIDQTYQEEQLIPRLAGQSKETLKQLELVYCKPERKKHQQDFMFLDDYDDEDFKMQSEDINWQLEQISTLTIFRNLQDLSIHMFYSSQLESLLVSQVLPQLRGLRKLHIECNYQRSIQAMDILVHYIKHNKRLEFVQINSKMDEDDLEGILYSQGNRRYCFVNWRLHISFEKFVELALRYKTAQIRVLIANAAQANLQTIDLIENQIKSSNDSEQI